MVIEINGVNKKIGSKQVIQDVSLSIGRGQVFALLGPNGAGKTTLIRIILGLLKAETGTIRLFGQELTGLISYCVLGFKMMAISMKI